MNDRLILFQCQKRLLITWLIGLIPAILIMSIRGLSGTFENKDQDIWGLFIPMFLPTLTLMIGSYAKTAFVDRSDSMTVDKFFFKISLGCSIFYISLLTMVIIYQPFIDSPALESFSRATIFLSVIQGITSACLGAFFTSQKNAEK